jgi:hypothetical protein
MTPAAHPTEPPTAPGNGLGPLIKGEDEQTGSLEILTATENVALGFPALRAHPKPPKAPPGSSFPCVPVPSPVGFPGPLYSWHLDLNLNGEPKAQMA